MSWLVVGKWILDNGKLIALGAMVLTLISLLWSWDSRGDRVEELERQAQGWNNAITTLDGVLKRNREDIAECEAINAENTSEIGRLKTDIAASEARVKGLNTDTEEDIARARNEGEAMRGRDTECRTADGDLPEWILAGVREPAPADRH